MAGRLESKITRFVVANLGNATASLLSLITYIPVGNSWAITCDPRLESSNFESQVGSPRINQRFPEFRASRVLHKSKCSRANSSKRLGLAMN